MDKTPERASFLRSGYCERGCHHPHLHCVVPGGGISPEGEWVSCRDGFFLPVKVLSRLFRRLFLEKLQQSFDRGKLRFHGDWAHLQERAALASFLRPLGKIEWVVYAKPPFGGPAQVLEYLGRYTHRVAISNERLVSQDDTSVSFRWKDYRHNNRQSVMKLSADEFLRRFLLHTLPSGFQRIRHYGLFSNRHRQEGVAAVPAAAFHSGHGVTAASEGRPPRAL